MPDSTQISTQSMPGMQNVIAKPLFLLVLLPVTAFSQVFRCGCIQMSLSDPSRFRVPPQWEHDFDKITISSNLPKKYCQGSNFWCQVASELMTGAPKTATNMKKYIFCRHTVSHVFLGGSKSRESVETSVRQDFPLGLAVLG